MSQLFENVTVDLDEDLEEKIAWLMPNFSDYRILKKSVDARRRSKVHFIYSFEIFEQGECPSEEDFKIEPASGVNEKPLIVGSGPAGLFAAIRFVERGVPCHIFERGSECGKRMVGIARHWRYGEFSPQNNVCFGEGGAGLYSDGKLITRIKSPYISYVMDRLVKFGAPEEIKYLANPHVGSDKIRRLIPRIRQFLIDRGCEFHFDAQVTELLTDTNNNIVGLKTIAGETFNSPAVILATGHSAEDMFQHLQDKGVHLEGKSFAMGLRIEHPQALINKIQYRESAEHPKLGAANYRLTYNDKKAQMGVYSFCMCPGGYVLSSGTEATGVVCNGMSNYRRNSPYSNSAVVVTVDHQKSFGDDIFGGVKLRQQLEHSAFQKVQQAGGSKELPAQKVLDFIKGRSGEALKGSSPSGAAPVRLDELLPKEISNYMLDALASFENKMPGFCSDQAQFYGMESRTSCPIRVTRHKDSLQSLSHPGLYPTGEGAGYAGGITSAACDGIKVAEACMNWLGSHVSKVLV